MGTTVEGKVEAFTSHGAFVTVGDARCYIPLSAMAEPPPRAAKEVLKRGETREFVIQALDPPRRGIELAQELTEEAWDAMLDINLKGAWLVARRVIPHMIARRSGVIINNSSVAGLRGMARLHGSPLCNMELVAVCDLNQDNANFHADEAKELLGTRPKVYSDIAQMTRELPDLNG